MKVRALKIEDRQKCEDYLSLHQSQCMFMCSNLKIAGIEYKGMDYEGEYFGCFNSCLEQLNGVIVHYWNGNIMMHASNQIILNHLVLHLKKKDQAPYSRYSWT
ncbi:MAG: hypothetical protein BGO07_02845 [Alphaproteobacteria bacterium 40-19]|nr:MAG: hypothetical protein BGO07_02845 [Alphaproteobacteria bacterium 40-19]